MSVTTTKDAPIMDGLRDAVDSITVSRVFGAPITQGGTIVLPVARIGGGAGSGSGTGPTEQGHESGGAGGGLGMSAKPLGVFVLRDGKVGWRPAVDVNKIIMGGQVVAVAALLVARAVITSRATRAHKGAWWPAAYEPAARFVRRVVPGR